MSGLVAYPAHLAAHAPHHHVGQQRVYGVAQVGYVVESLRVVYLAVARGALSAIGAAVVASMVATGGTVKPHLKLVVAILGQFHALWQEHLFGVVVGVVAVGVLLAPVFAAQVPWRHVEAVFHLQLACRPREVARDVGLARVGGGRAQHAVRRGGRRPQAEAIVVLHHGNAAFHARRLGHAQPLCRVGHASGREGRLVFSAVAPFLAGVGVHAIVEESVKLGLVPQHLPAARQGEHRARRVVGIGELKLGRDRLCHGRAGRRQQA